MQRSILTARLVMGLIATTLAVHVRAAQVPADATPIPSTAMSGYAASIMAGISDQGQNLQQPYVTAGNRAYLIGTQDGNFPDMGHHIPGEMGGLWLPPIKLIDGFQARIAEGAAGKDILLSQAGEMITYPYGNLFRYGRVMDDLDVERFQYSPDHRQGVIILPRPCHKDCRCWPQSACLCLRQRLQAHIIGLAGSEKRDPGQRQEDQADIS